MYNPQMTQTLMACLNDYTNDQQRGDIGSNVRKEAITTASFALRKGIVPVNEESQQMIIRICALATELLDEVRIHAALCLRDNWQAFGFSAFPCP